MIWSSALQVWIVIRKWRVGGERLITDVCVCVFVFVDCEGGRGGGWGGGWIGCQVLVWVWNEKNNTNTTQNLGGKNTLAVASVRTIVYSPATGKKGNNRKKTHLCFLLFIAPDSIVARLSTNLLAVVNRYACYSVRLTKVRKSHFNFLPS